MNIKVENALKALEALNELTTGSIIALDRSVVNEQAMTIKEKCVQEVHPYTITLQPSGRWKTRIVRSDGKRVAVERTERKELIAFLFDHYAAGQKKEVSFRECFEEMVEEKLRKKNRSNETAERNRYTFKRFISEDFGNKKISTITEDQLSQYVQTVIEEKHPIKTALKAFAQIIHGVFGYALKKGYVKSDVSQVFEVENYFSLCAQKERTDEELIFSSDQIEKVKKVAWEKTPNPRAFMVLLSIETGLRVGELAALHWSDISDGVIHIHRQQLLKTQNGKRVGFEEVLFTKNEKNCPKGGRYIPLTDGCQKVLRAVQAAKTDDSGYVFSENGAWVTKTSYSVFLRRLCRSLGLPATRNHVFRRTFNSEVLANSGVNSKQRASILGHSVETNERYYTFTHRAEIEGICEKINAQAALNHPKNKPLANTRQKIVVFPGLNPDMQKAGNA